MKKFKLIRQLILLLHVLANTHPKEEIIPLRDAVEEKLKSLITK